MNNTTVEEVIYLPVDRVKKPSTRTWQKMLTSDKVTLTPRSGDGRGGQEQKHLNDHNQHVGLEH